MILKAEGNRVQGHGGCNGFGGTYELTGDDGIGFSKIVSTKMACHQMETETRLFEVLQSVDSYQIKGDTLLLNKGNAGPMAQFETVYLK
jgi:heat shock protein HslJ